MLPSEMITKLFAGLVIMFVSILAIIICGLFSDYIAPRSKMLMRFMEWYAGPLEDEE